MLFLTPMYFKTRGSKTDNSKRYWLLYILYAALALLLYAPVLHKSFAADDFSVLYRIIHDGQLLEKGFFRPVSDISLYTSYLYSGLNPLGYNLFNVLTHAFNAFILYRVLLLLAEDRNNAGAVAFAGGLLFLAYPFHNESVIWVVGRASLLAACFSFLVVWISLEHDSPWAKATAFLFYFIAMSSYETSLLLPLVVGLLLYLKKRKPAAILSWMLVLFAALAMNLLARRISMEEMVGDYASRLFEWRPAVLAPKIIKVFGRFWLPPMANAARLTLLTAIVGLSLSAIAVYYIRAGRSRFYTAAILFGCFLLASALAFLFGVSTKTVEGDRVLYFGSFFLCAWIAWVAGDIIGRSGLAFWLPVSGILLFYVLCLSDNNRRWKTAGERTVALLNQVRLLAVDQKPLLIVNLPEEYRGALMFRNGFYQALLLQGIDTAAVRVAGYQGSSVNGDPDLPVVPVQRRRGEWQIGETNVVVNGAQVRVIDGNAANMSTFMNGNIYYWNNRRLLPLKIAGAE